LNFECFECLNYFDRYYKL